MTAVNPPDEAALRAAIDRQRWVAMALFEQQIIRVGGRKPGDPTWDDLCATEQDEFWDSARDAIPLIDLAIAAEYRRFATHELDEHRVMLHQAGRGAKASTAEHIIRMVKARADEFEREAGR